MTEKRKPHQDFQCQDCSADFKRYDTKQTRCPSCQEQFRNTRMKEYKKDCKDCGNSFMSRSCRAERCDYCWHNGTCQVCSAVFTRKSQTKKYCSVKCSAIAKADYYYGGNYSKTLIRDGWQCRKCETKDGLQVHHIDHSGAENTKTFNANNEMWNLITLCAACHSEVHTMTDKHLVQKYNDEVRDLLLEYVGGDV